MGVAVATAALVCIMSVFNGFQDMVADLFNAFDPELKVVAVEGKFMSADAKELQELKKNPDIAVFSEVIEDNALLVANNHQVMATVKGVDDNFEKLLTSTVSNMVLVCMNYMPTCWNMVFLESTYYQH